MATIWCLLCLFRVAKRRPRSTRMASRRLTDDGEGVFDTMASDLKQFALRNSRFGIFELQFVHSLLQRFDVFHKPFSQLTNLRTDLGRLLGLQLLEHPTQPFLSPLELAL